MSVSGVEFLEICCQVRKFTVNYPVLRYYASCMYCTLLLSLLLLLEMFTLTAVDYCVDACTLGG
jgi:hypothetical protein